MTTASARSSSSSAAIEAAPTQNAPRWLATLRWTALAVWLLIPPLGILAQPVAGRLVWTVAVASLPLFIVLVGYHNWRRMCPLAFFSQIPVRLRRPGSRRISGTFERHYYFLTFMTFFVGLWLRLIWTNGDGVAIATFFTLISLIALASGALFTGKTWCNYICPVSFIEKVYTEPRGLRDTSNSQCDKCTACKKACPDINEENGYWREVDLPAKRFVYFAFPGLVFGFYFYFFLQAGTWDYYFGGTWTNEPGVILRAFQPGSDPRTAGFFLLTWIPRALAASLTLALCALGSFGVFLCVEQLVSTWMKRRTAAVEAAQVRNVTFGIAAFTAFVTFYSFAGQPTLRKVEWLPTYANALVVLVASLFLVRRLVRTRERFAEQTLARSIIKRWPWPDTPPPTNLHDAYVINAARTTERERLYSEVLTIYQDAVREVLADGIVTHAEVQQLDALRRQLEIRAADHDRVMTMLADEQRVLLTEPSMQASAEKRLQLETYTRALEHHLAGLASTAEDGAAGAAFIQQLRTEFGVTSAEHSAVLANLFEGRTATASRAAEGVKFIERATRCIGLLSHFRSPTLDALIDVLRRNRARAVDRLLSSLAMSPSDPASLRIRDGLCSDGTELYEAAVAKAQTYLQQSVRDYLADARAAAVLETSTLLSVVDVLEAQILDADPFVRALALYGLAERECLQASELARACEDSYGLVRETAMALHERQAANGVEQDPGTLLLTIQKMIALRCVPIFDALVPDALEELARSSDGCAFAPGEALCIEGDLTDEVFVILSGEARVVHGPSADGELIRVEATSGVIGELAVLDSAPRAASIFAGASGVRALRLTGPTFRMILHGDSSVAFGVIHTLARRLRGAQQHAPAPPPASDLMM
jgi:hypothetical protein